MGSPPACSVVIPTYNRMELLGRTLDSLTKQDIGTDSFEVLVVDDGSADDTATMVAQFHDRLRLHYFYQPDRGFRAAAARNVGLAHASGEITVFVDSGVLLDSGCLRAHLLSHDADELAAVVGSVYCFNLDNEDADAMLRALDFDDVDGTIARLRRECRWLDAREEFYANEPSQLRDLPAPWLYYWTCNVSARTGQVRDVGGFDEVFRTWGSEDIDLGYRLHRDGAVFVLNREASALHHPHHKDFPGKQEIARRNLRYIAAKYDTPITRLLAAEPPIAFDDINRIILQRGLPSCADHRRDAVQAAQRRGTLLR
ncbi:MULTISPECIES: glycosyltransferase family 2 protein [unclassified Micromonospora]|uniref:glycosyltransferase family 2 protein n=1 Tax=unclassified Micromonospora TaxID=2617518 RepID=UPI003A877464